MLCLAVHWVLSAPLVPLSTWALDTPTAATFVTLNLRHLASSFVFTELALRYQLCHKWLQDGMGIMPGRCKINLIVSAGCGKNAQHMYIVWVSVQRKFAHPDISNKRELTLCVHCMGRNFHCWSRVVLAYTFFSPFYREDRGWLRRGACESESKRRKWWSDLLGLSHSFPCSRISSK